MNPLVVWLPSVAAAALLGTAVVVMSDTDDSSSVAAAAIPLIAPAAQPAAFETAEQIAQEAEPSAEEVQPDAEELQAVQDGDGSSLLTIMEEQLENSRRILSTMKNSPPTIKALKAIMGFRKRASREIRELKDMGAARVTADVFHRAEEVIAEIKALEAEAVEIMRAEKARRGAARHQPAAEPERPQPAFEPQQPAYAPQQPAYAPQQPTFEPQQPAYAPQQPAYAPQQPAYAPQQF